MLQSAINDHRELSFKFSSEIVNLTRVEVSTLICSDLGEVGLLHLATGYVIQVRLLFLENQMLQYETKGPDAAGEFAVTYLTPGCEVPTVVCAGVRSRTSADREAQRRNDAQLNREKVLQAAALARGLYGVYPDISEA